MQEETSNTPTCGVFTTSEKTSVLNTEEVSMIEHALALYGSKDAGADAISRALIGGPLETLGWSPVAQFLFSLMVELDSGDDPDGFVYVKGREPVAFGEVDSKGRDDGDAVLRLLRVLKRGDWLARFLSESAREWERGSVDPTDVFRSLMEHVSNYRTALLQAEEASAMYPGFAAQITQHARTESEEPELVHAAGAGK